MPFIKLAATEIVSGVSGESEEKVRELFSRAVVRKRMKIITILAFIKATTTMVCQVPLGTNRNGTL